MLNIKIYLIVGLTAIIIVLICAIGYFAINLNEGSPISILAFAAPIMMYLLLRYASGIPPLEAYMLQTRGEVFAEYQQTTSPFFPLPPKESKR